MSSNKYFVIGLIILFVCMNYPETKNFKSREFDSKDGKKVPLIYYPNLRKLMNNLEVIRAYFGKPVYINSGYRSPQHNQSVGGSLNSQHMLSKAADIVVQGIPASEVQSVLIQLMDEGKIDKGGVGCYSNFTHYDIRGKKVVWS